MADDDSLPAALAADLDRAFETMVLGFQDRLYAFALRLTGRPADAHEIVQDALVRAYHALRRYPVTRRRALAVRPWLYRITLNVTRNRVRAQRRATRRLDALGASHPEPAGDPAEQPEARLLGSERRRAQARRLADLPDRYRAAVVLRHVQGLGYAEVAAILGQPVGTAKANVHRGLGLLRAALDKEDTT
jgi:RNA polymerase sigma-70 factor (ECF subfamily)